MIKEKPKGTKNIRLETIKDFSNQWKIHGKLNKGFWTDKFWLENICSNIFNLNDIKNKVVCEIGSGSGRIANMLYKFNPKFIHCVEPSPDIKTLKKNISSIKNIKVHNLMGHEFDIKKIDYFFSIGVIHHIAEPTDVIQNIYKCLKNNGEFIMWVYGHEGNGLYLFIYKLLSIFTKRMNDTFLDYFANMLNYILLPYIYISKLNKNFPMHDYIKNVFEPCNFEDRKYIIFDQLNPQYAKYYKKQECIDLFKKNGFKDIKIKQFNRYSWTIKGKKIE